MGSEIVEGVIEFAYIRGITVAETNVVRSDHVKFGRHLRNQIAEHMRRTGEAV